MLLFDTAPAEMAERRAGGKVPLFVACGLGVNSTAGLILMQRLGDRPDVVLFADTGGEKPETYAYRDILSRWLVSVGFPEIITVRRNVIHSKQKHEIKYNTLEEECLVKKCLPSIAYYRRSCSDKWKIWPQEKFANSWAPARERWSAGGRCVKAIFYDADEPNRAKINQTDKWAYWYPVLDHDWGREECLKAIDESGLPEPPKSSCFFCPEMTPAEIMALSTDLQGRALHMEGNANLTKIKGLGKHEYSWSDLIAGRIAMPMAKEKKLPCVCHFG